MGKKCNSTGKYEQSLEQFTSEHFKFVAFSLNKDYGSSEICLPTDNEFSTCC